MSFNRENVTWQSRNGTWNRGFFRVSHYTGDDPEWDVEYDESQFEWVTTGHVSSDAADAVWNGANPGGGMEVPYSTENASDCEEFDHMARQLQGTRSRSVPGGRR